MSAGFLTACALLTAIAALAVPLTGDLPPLPRMRVRASLVLLVAVGGLVVAGSLAWRAAPPDGSAGGVPTELAALLAATASVLGGGPISASVLRLADKHPRTDRKGPADPTVLHGGAWIGALERLAVTGTLLAGYPEGLVVVLGIKGLGRYPELRQPAASERFIIGTLASILWACGCAGVGILLLR